MIVGVMGSGTEPHEDLAVPVGRAVAENGWHLLTGGGGGVMEAAARGFCRVPDRKGLSIGVLRSRAWPELGSDGRRRWAPRRKNDWLELEIATHLPTSDQDLSSRNHVNVLTAHVLVVLPGGSGTLSELRLRVQYGRDAWLWLGGRAVGGLSVEDLTADPALRPRLHVPSSFRELVAGLRRQADQADPSWDGSEETSVGQ